MKFIQTVVLTSTVLIATTLTEASAAKKSKANTKDKAKAAAAVAATAPEAAPEAAEGEGDELFGASLVVDGKKAEQAGSVSPTTSTSEMVSDASTSATSVGSSDPLVGSVAGENLDAALAAAESETAGQEKIDASKLPEDKIPVLAQTGEVKKASGGQFTKMMTTLGVLALLLGGICFALRRWIKSNPKSKEQTKIKVITQHHLGPKKSLAIVRVAGESILIGITDQNISMLKTLSLLDEEIPEETPRTFNRAMDDFDEVDHDQEASSLTSLNEKSRRSRNQEQIAIDHQRQMHEDEDFTISGLSEIRDSVSSRLKNMKSF